MSLGLVEISPYWTWRWGGIAALRCEYRRPIRYDFPFPWELSAPALPPVRALDHKTSPAAGEWLDETDVNKLEINSSSLGAITDWLKTPYGGVASTEALYKTYCDPILTPEQIRELMG